MVLDLHKMYKGLRLLLRYKLQELSWAPYQSTSQHINTLLREEDMVEAGKHSTGVMRYKRHFSWRSMLNRQTAWIEICITKVR